MVYHRNLPKSFLALLATVLLVTTVQAFGTSDKKVLLQNVQTLTLRKDRQTTHRRVPAVPQLKCIGGNACRYYQVDILRCVNAGSDYDENNIQWTCKAEIPDDFKMGSTDVRCEGYTNSKDPYILKGSCGVEYRLVLTDKGEERFGSRDRAWSTSNSTGGTFLDRLLGKLFWLFFLGVVFWMAYSAFTNMRNNRGNAPRPPRNPNAGRGGGGWWGGGDDGPPPPYSQFPPRKPNSSRPDNNAQGWQPGFWSGVLGGGAAGYLAGQRGGRNNQRRDNNSDFSRFAGSQNRGWGNYDNGGEGSSSYSSTTHTSTGFGSTSNR